MILIRYLTDKRINSDLMDYLTSDSKKNLLL